MKINESTIDYSTLWTKKTINPEYAMTFVEAIQAMKEGHEVRREGDRGPYKMTEDGMIRHYIYGPNQYVEACLTGECFRDRWRVVEPSKYI